MKIDICIAGHLVDVIPGLKRQYKDYEVQDGTTLSNLAEKLNIKPELVFMFVVNKEREDDHYILKNGDVVTIFSPSAGG